MAKKTSPSEPGPVWGTCSHCGQRFIAGYEDDVVLSAGCQPCVAGLFRVIEQSPTVLVPLPDAAGNATPAAAPADVPSRPTRRPRPRVRPVPLYEPLTPGLRRRFRRHS